MGRVARIQENALFIKRYENRQFALSTEEAPEGYRTTLDQESLEKKELEG